MNNELSMLEAINTWGDYKAKVREFDAVLEHGKATSAALAGFTSPSVQARCGGLIYVKLVSHCVALRSLAAQSGERTVKDLLDMPSMSALARCAVEAHDAFEYIAGHDVTDSERGFRIQLWELHDATRRLKMFGDMGAVDPRVDAIRADLARRQAALEAHAFFASLHADLQAALRQRMAKGDSPAFHLGQRQRCALSGVNADWHNAVTLQLSQQVHTLPSSVQLPLDVQPGTTEALRLMALPLLFTLPFLARATLSTAHLIPERAPEPPSRTARTMAWWRALAEQGTQSRE
ncbi:hypothetical protein [Roseateles sp.]|uniref:hypothetical protein n=1 Tax=Roseateles sp. TaxID=1971397 RepID=UPI003263C1FD